MLLPPIEQRVCQFIAGETYIETTSFDLDLYGGQRFSWGLVFLNNETIKCKLMSDNSALPLEKISLVFTWCCSKQLFPN